MAAISPNQVTSRQQVLLYTAVAASYAGGSIK